MVVLVASYLLAVWTRTGQAVENAALRGADQVAEQDAVEANETLSAITLISLIGAMILVAVIALLRRRLDLAVAAVGVIVLGQMLTQALKRFILPRPDLVEVAGDYSHNSFPSGHTTIAMTAVPLPGRADVLPLSVGDEHRRLHRHRQVAPVQRHDRKRWRSR